MLFSLSFIALGFFTTNVSSRFPTLPTAQSIRSLFYVPAGTQLTYPPTDISGPYPRKEWIQAYQRAKQAGLIPSLPNSTIVDYEAVYPPLYRGTVCNPGLSQCNSSVDVITAPAGMAGISFDDGPQPPSRALLSYLKSQNQKATHFLIGSRIINNPDTFKDIDRAGHHLAVHTYSHPMMTSMTDLQVVGELGWTMQLIHDKSEKHVICRHWRPPYGDTDQRVQAIAKHVFGLETILWYYDPRDWCLTDSSPGGSACSPGNGPQSLSELVGGLKGFLRAPKSQGLMILEHEHHTRCVEGFKTIFPLMKQLKWIPKTIPDLFNAPWYQ